MPFLDSDQLEPVDIQTALVIARETDGDLDPPIHKYLESQLSTVWTKLDAEPDTYIMTKDEFSVFSFYINRFEHSELAEKVIARFWANYSSAPCNNPQDDHRM